MSFKGISYPTRAQRALGIGETITVHGCPSEEVAQFAVSAARARHDRVETDRTTWAYSDLLNEFANIKTEIERRFKRDAEEPNPDDTLDYWMDAQ